MTAQPTLAATESLFDENGNYTPSSGTEYPFSSTGASPAPSPVRTSQSSSSSWTTRAT